MPDLIEYKLRLKHEIQKARKHLKNQIFQTISNPEGDIIHFASQWHLGALEYDHEYQKRVKEIMQHADSPLKIASSRADCYHQWHFSNASLLAIIIKQGYEPEYIKPSDLMYHSKYTDSNYDEIERLECQEKWYKYLEAKVKKDSPIKTIKITERLDKLESQVSKLIEWKDQSYGGSKRKAMD